MAVLTAFSITLYFSYIISANIGRESDWISGYEVIKNETSINNGFKRGNFKIKLSQFSPILGLKIDY